MSRSPQTESPSERELDEYLAGWRATMRLVSKGRSFSGRERNCVYLNCGPTPFADVSAATGLDFPDDGRALALIDWDDDGDLDLWLRNRTGPRLRLMVNQTRQRADAGQFVAFRLRGATGNTDGIGARVEVVLEDSGQGRLVQTVHAGDSFLSQSPARVHFGLGRGQRIARVLVDWPAGALESFTGVEPDGHYLLVEGSGEAQPWRRPAARLALGPGEQVPPRETQRSRAVLAARLPLPRMRYTALDGTGEELVSAGGRPLLLNLWASWCAPCVSELKELTQHAAELSSELDVLALSVDGLDGTGRSAPADARRVLDAIEFRWRSGLATPELLDKLEMIEELLFERMLEFAVPVSLLLDAKGDLAVIYRGPLGLKELQRDVGNLQASAAELQFLSVPFHGRWASVGGEFLLDRVAPWFGERYPEDELAYLEAHRDRTAARAEELGPQAVAQAHLALARAYQDAGRASAALAEFRAAADVDGDSIEARVGLGGTLIAIGRPAEALPVLEELTARGVEDPGVWFHLAQAQRALGSTDEALASYQRVLALDPRFVEAHNNLGTLYQQLGRLDEAIEHHEQAIQIDPEEGLARYNLGVELRARGRFDEALTHLREACRLEPGLYQPQQLVAILLLNHPVEARRDPAGALPYAERAAELSSGENLSVLQTLTNAYLLSGRKEDAIATARRALDVATRQGNEPMAAGIRAFIDQLGG